MKKFYAFLAVLLAVATAQATIRLTDGEKYRIVCAYAPGGAIVLGAYHDAVPYVYYLTDTQTVPDDAWWIVGKDGKGYTLRNAASDQYLIYHAGRPTNAAGQYLAKGLQLTEEIPGDAARWIFSEEDDGSVSITNVGQPDEAFNLRTDGTWLVGTYDGSITANGRFYLYDTAGKSVTDGGDAGGDKSPLAAYADSIRLDGKGLIFDRKTQTFYATIAPKWRGGMDYRGKLTFKSTKTDGTYTLQVSDYATDASDSIMVPQISGKTDYTLDVIGTGGVVASAPLRFTFMPIVEVDVPSCNGSFYTSGTLRVTDPETEGGDSAVIAAFKYRGASAQNFSKKSYAIKLRDAAGNSVDREYFGLREDNNWILDAMAVDQACMRNRVSTDLWNDFSTKPYHRRDGREKKAKTGTRGRFVEVFLNGTYHGLYCMTEKMDRKQLRLKKFVASNDEHDDTIHGSLYKSSQWNYEVLMGHDTDTRYFPHRAPRAYNNDARSETWADYEVKYPDWEDEKVDWGPLWNAINFVATASDAQFDREIDTWFDYPVLKDYYLFLELLLATDNHGKNLFLFNYDQKSPTNTRMIGLAPWDLDGTWGRRWDGSDDITGAEQDFDSFLWRHEHGQWTPYYRLQRSSRFHWTNELKERYAELREKEFDADALVKRFTDYASLFADSGADAREAKRWTAYHADIASDVNYITTWIRDRVAYLDRQYGYTPIPSGIDKALETDGGITAIGGVGSLHISATGATTIDVFTAGGLLVRRITPDGPATTITGLAPGVYIVGMKKVVVY